MEKPDVPQHDETIVPVKPGLRNVRESTAPEPNVAPLAGQPKSRLPLAAVAGAVLFIAAIAVFVWLPSLVAESRAEREQAAAAQRQRAEAAAVAPVRPALSAEEAAALESEAERLLASLLTQQQRLEQQAVASWGGADWSRYEELLRSGDDALLAKDFRVAVRSYTDATTLGERLLVQGVQTLEGALTAAEAAFAAGDAALAMAQYDLVLGIEPGNARALAGRERAARLPDVLAAVRRAAQERADGNLSAALTSYRDALAIDAAWEPASRAVNEIERELRDADFDRLLSAGFSALAAEDYGVAEEHFRGALALKPDAREVREGLTQAEEGAKLDRIALTEARALAFERRELWDQAIEQYRAVLTTDANLLFARTGLERAESRADLDVKLKNLIDNPTLLFGDTVLAAARQLLDQAAAVPEQGPRLTQQLADLDRLVKMASDPLPVRLESDLLTNVTLYRVGALGTFTAKQVELRPGTYTVIGSRDGYRDVRQTFTVLPGRELAPISVVCVEPI